ncbi:hypothetical protein BUALT_Bualt19G0038900 [Buddleja alternifolia]|uniref:Homeobox domain-containing protein n=1 Tax=Buddleja alternifolia TaxID=168488 RepID=A0AAV6W553_9LAMI|nr:hypothetical protein BUALT_Bualt19G0038900 [Buddleja alternifolia]
MKRLEKHQIEALKLAFQESNHLTKEKKIELAAATGLDVEPINSWFSRKRARKRVKELIAHEEAHAMIQDYIRLSQESAAELQNELQESKRREAGLQAEHQLLKQRLKIAENGDGQFGPN